MHSASSPLAHNYDTVFYRYQSEGSLRSAEIILPLIVKAFAIKSILDIGCGIGTWLSVAQALGLHDIAGMDGHYVDRSLLLIDKKQFTPCDISKPCDAGRSFDLVQCLEVAEHVPSECTHTLVSNIVRHGRLVMFSAAVPGQGGENHINEQPYEYWRNLFAQHGYRLFDFVRSRVSKTKEVEPWYRYNLLLFAHDSVIPHLPATVSSTRVFDHSCIRDYAPLGYQIRKAILRQLPSTFISRLAVWKHQRTLLKKHQG